MSDTHNPSALRPYLGRYDLMRLTGPGERFKDKPGGKNPSQSNWRITAALNFDEADAHMAVGKNIGIRLQAADLVLDVDPRNGGDVSLARLATDLGVDFSDWPRVTTGSGGCHIYMTKAPDTAVCGKLAGYDGIDIKTAGGLLVSAGAVHPNGNAYRWDDDPLAMPLSAIMPAPQSLLDLLKRNSESAHDVDPGDLTPDDLALLLDVLDVIDFRDEQKWREVMMASHHATNGAGLDVFLAWSTSDPSYASSFDDISIR